MLEGAPLMRGALPISTVAEHERHEEEPAEPQGRLEMPGCAEGRRSWLWRIGLFLYVYSDTMLSGECFTVKIRKDLMIKTLYNLFKFVFLLLLLLSLLYLLLLLLLL